MSLPVSDMESLYTPIPKDTIRCVKLTGTSLAGEHARRRDLAIECSLETVRLSDVREKKVSYRALSYVWGSPKFCRWIVCNGVLKAVTSNLYEALWHFTFGPESTPLLWIDAICINQDDNDDKAQQVSMMADIYREAELVLIWLGKDPAANPALERFWTNLNTVGARAAVKDREAFDRGVAFINNADWFTRTWTVQEIVLAREARICSGFFGVDWTLFDELSGFADDDYLSRSRSDSISSGNSFQEEEISATGSVFPAIEILSRLRRPHSMPNPTLYQLVRATWDRAATNPRDKLYGLLGLWDGGARIVPDYGRSVSQVFAQVVLTVLEEEKWLWLNMKNIKPIVMTATMAFKSRQSVLSVDTSGSSVSWIPDLRDKNVDEAEKLVDFPGDWRFQGPKWPEPTFTSLHPSFVPDFGLLDTSLIARGVILGTWRRVEASKKVGWRYQGEGVFEGFPPCVAKFSMDDFHHEAEPTFPPATAVYEAMSEHIRTNCACDHQGTAAYQSHDRSSASRQEGEDSPRVNETDALAWLCLVFGKAEPLILKPSRSAEEPELAFQIANRLPYQHPWAAQILRAGRFEAPEREDGLWHDENRWRMDAVSVFEGDRSSTDARGWHDRLAKISRIKARSEGRGGTASLLHEDRQPLSLAFREGSTEEKKALKKLEGNFDKMPDLNDCHLNWIPTTFKMKG